MNHRSRVIVIPNSFMRRCASFQWSWAVKAPLSIPMPLCVQNPLWPFGDVPQDVLKRKIHGPVEEHRDIPLLYPIPTKRHVFVCSGTCMLVYVHVDIRVFNGEIISIPQGFWSTGICSDADMKHLAVHNTHIQPGYMYIHIGSEGIGIIVWGSIFVCRLWSLSLCRGWWRFETTFPTSAWEGRRARDGLRKKRAVSDRNLHSPPVHNATVWARVFVSLDAGNATFGQTSAAPTHL